MKHKINILIPIFVLLVLVYAVRSVAGTRIKVETLRRGSMEDMISTKGVMIKYESVISPETDGAFEALVQEGAKVSAGQEVAAVYAGTVDTDLRSRLEQVTRKIAQIEKNQADLITFSGDISKLEQKITEQTAELIEKTQQGDLSSINSIQFVLEALCEKKAQISGDTQSSGVLDELRQQKADLEGQIGNAHRRLRAPVAGEFTSAVDGFEQIITPYNMTELTPSKIDSLLEQEHSTGADEKAACKIMQNFRYFIAVNLPADRVSTLREGNSVKLRFYDLSSELIQAEIFYITPEEEGYKTVILESDRYLESLLKRRFVNLDFVKSRHEGYRVSVKALHTKDDVTGVYVRRDDVLKFIPITILHNTQDTAIIDSADEGLPLRLYDEVVISASSYEEGKLLR